MSRMARPSELRSFWMRSSCSESRRLRSVSSVCTARRLEMRVAMYHEYATTASSVNTRPARRPGTGEKLSFALPPEDDIDAVENLLQVLRPQSSSAFGEECSIERDDLRPVGDRVFRQPSRFARQRHVTRSIRPSRVTRERDAYDRGD